MMRPSRLAFAGLAILVVAGGALYWVKRSSGVVKPARVPYGFPSDTTLYMGRSTELPGDASGAPAPDRALLDRAIELRKSGQAPRALELFEELARRNPKLSEAYVYAAMVRLDSRTAKDSALADTLLANGISQDPGHPWLLLLQARQLFARGKIKETRETLEKALDFAPTFRPAMELMARLEMKSGNLLRAQRLAQLSLSLGGKKDTLPYDLIAEALFSREKDDSARECVNLGLSLFPHEPRYFWIRGLLAETKGDTTAARRDYETARSSGRIPEAEEALRTLGLKPLHGRGRVEGTFSGTQSSEITFALEVLQPLVRAYPRSAPLHYALGRAWQEKGYLAQADDAYHKALSLDSTVPGLVDWTRENRKLLVAKAKVFATAAASPGEASSTSTDDHWYDLGHYRIAWGTTRPDFISRYPPGRFEKPTPASLFEARTMWGIEHRQLLRFDSTGLWSVRVTLVDAGKTSVDLLEEGIRLNALQAGSGNFEDPKMCGELGQIESVWWETADTYELMVQPKKTPKRLGLIRMRKDRVPTGGICEIAPMAMDTLP